MGNDVNPPPRHQPTCTSRAQGDHGKITQWQPADPQAGDRPRQREFREMDDCLNWPTSGKRGDAHVDEDPTRFGKRYYGQAPPASELAPYGRTSDLRVDASHQARRGAQDGRRLKEPYGTEKDHRHKRPEEAGTEEYRSALCKGVNHR